jgi:hypothetical protein
MKFSPAIVVACLACAFLVASPAQACGPSGPDRAALEAYKAGGFAVEQRKERERLARALVDCLGDPDPAVRDGIAFEGLMTMLRAGALDAGAMKDLHARLNASLRAAPDAGGFRRPFTALALAEIARADRVTPFLAPKARAAFVADAAAYMIAIDDYRGFVDGEGWRHGAAHGADWLMQLALNPAVGRAELELIEAAIAAQAAPGAHAYIHGESARLARPLLFAARREEFAGRDWNDYFRMLSDPAPLGDWSAALASEPGLARLHNLKAFLAAAHLGAGASGDPALAPFAAASLEALAALP